MHWESVKRLCNESLSKQKELLYKLNIATVKTLEYHMDACIGKHFYSNVYYYNYFIYAETQCWQDAVDCGEVLTEAYRSVFHEARVFVQLFSHRYSQWPINIFKYIPLTLLP